MSRAATRPRGATVPPNGELAPLLSLRLVTHAVTEAYPNHVRGVRRISVASKPGTLIAGWRVGHEPSTRAPQATRIRPGSWCPPCPEFAPLCPCRPPIIMAVKWLTNPGTGPTLETLALRAYRRPHCTASEAGGDPAIPCISYCPVQQELHDGSR